MRASGQMLGAARYQPSNTALASSAPRFIQFRPGRVSGADLIFAESFR